MSSHLLTWAFAAILLLSLAVKFWLTTRQIRHVAAHRNQVPPAFQSAVSLGAHQKAADYTMANSRYGLLTTAFGTGVLVAWTLLGGLDWLNHSVRELVMPRFGPMAYQLSLLTSFVLIGSLVELPLEAYHTFRIEHQFGFNRMSPKLWLADLLKGTALSALIGLPLAALILWIMGHSGGLWWLWAWGAWVAFNLLLLVIYPTWIAPMFNKFEPLQDEGLKTRVQALMLRCGFAAKGLFVMDGSKRSAHANAYFTGLGASKRVVFFDTLLKRLEGPEVEAVLAHELGHFKHKHVAKRLVGIFAISLLGLALLGWLAGKSSFYTGLGVAPNLAAPNDALALLLFSLALPPVLYFVSPLMAHFSRHDEFQADAYACSQADGQALARALLKLHEDNASTLTPDPWYAKFYYSHPPAIERLAALPIPRSSAGPPPEPHNPSHALS